MNNILHDLLIEEGMEAKDTGTVKVYYNAQNGRHSFWVVIYVDTLDAVLSNQSTHFAEVKEALQNEWFDKNANMLVVYKALSIDAADNAKTIMIEENPYIFKKQVLAYTKAEEEALTSAVMQSNKSIGKFIQQKILSNTVFERHKKELNNNDFESLIYRMMHKIPFIKVAAKQDTGLAALEEDNQAKVAASTYAHLNDAISENYFGMEQADLDRLTPETLYDTITAILDTNENQ